MTDFRRFPGGSSRQLIDYSRFVSLTGEKVFICLDRGVMEAARYLLNSRGSWRTTWVKEYVGTIGYNMPTEAEFEIVKNAIAEANEDMSSCDDLVTAIESVAAAIGSAPSSGGCGCVGSGDDDITSVNDGPGEEIPAGESFPPGFTDRPEYDTYRCKAAYWLLRNYTGTLRNWGGLFGMLGGLTIAVVAGLLLLTVPPAGLMLIVSALGLLATTDIGLLATLNLIADGIEENIDALACDLYDAESAAAAAEVIRDAAIEEITELDLGGLSSVFQQITDNLISNDQCDVLVNKDPAIDELPEEDCSACSPVEYWWSCLLNDEEGFVDITPTTLEVDAFFDVDHYILAIGYVNPVDWTVEVTAGSFSTFGGWPSDFYYSADLDNPDYCGTGNGVTWTVVSSTWDLSPTNKRTIQYVSGSFFRMKFTRID